MKWTLVALLGFALAHTAAAAVEVGSTVPDLTLASLGGADRTLSDRDAPTVLVFFRGAW